MMKITKWNELRATLYGLGATCAGAGGAALLAATEPFALAKGAVLVLVGIGIFLAGRTIERKPKEA